MTATKKEDYLVRVASVQSTEDVGKCKSGFLRNIMLCNKANRRLGFLSVNTIKFCSHFREIPITVASNQTVVSKFCEPNGFNASPTFRISLKSFF